MEAGDALRFASFSDVMAAYSEPSHLKYHVLRDYIKMLKERDGMPQDGIPSESSSPMAHFDLGILSESPSAYVDDYEGGVAFCDKRDNQVPILLCTRVEHPLHFACNMNVIFVFL